ncbi:hypothetical protein IKN40_01370 [bacterium]|nr:hypothetical protein [bacterium]
MKKVIIKLNERIIKSIFSLKEVMEENQRLPNLHPDFCNSCSKWYEEEGSHIGLTLDIIGALCIFTRKLSINKKEFYRLQDVAKVLRDTRKYDSIDFKSMDRTEKAVLAYFKDMPQSGVITYKI